MTSPLHGSFSHASVMSEKTTKNATHLALGHIARLIRIQGGYGTTEMSRELGMNGPGYGKRESKGILPFSPDKTEAFIELCCARGGRNVSQVDINTLRAEVAKASPVAAWKDAQGFPGKLKALRTMLALTPQDVAFNSSILQTARYVKFENGDRKPTAQELEAIISYFSKWPDRLLIDEKTAFESLRDTLNQEHQADFDENSIANIASAEKPASEAYSPPPNTCLTEDNESILCEEAVKASITPAQVRWARLSLMRLFAHWRFLSNDFFVPDAASLASDLRFQMPSKDSKFAISAEALQSLIKDGTPPPTPHFLEALSKECQERMRFGPFAQDGKAISQGFASGEFDKSCRELISLEKERKAGPKTVITDAQREKTLRPDQIKKLKSALLRR